MPQAGVEPATARFLRPPPLPLGYCGSPANRHRFTVSALSRSRTCTDADLGRAPLPLGYQSIPTLGFFVHMDAGGTRTLILRVQTGCPPSWTTDPCRSRSRVAGRARTFNLGLRRAALVRSSCRNVTSVVHAGFEPAHPASEAGASACWASEPSADGPTRAWRSRTSVGPFARRPAELLVPLADVRHELGEVDRLLRLRLEGGAVCAGLRRLVDVGRVRPVVVLGLVEK